MINKSAQEQSPKKRRLEEIIHRLCRISHLLWAQCDSWARLWLQTMFCKIMYSVLTGINDWLIDGLSPLSVCFSEELVTINVTRFTIWICVNELVFNYFSGFKWWPRYGWTRVILRVSKVKRPPKRHPRTFFPRHWHTTLFLRRATKASGHESLKQNAQQHLLEPSLLIRPLICNILHRPSFTTSTS